MYEQPPTGAHSRSTRVDERAPECAALDPRHTPVTGRTSRARLADIRRLRQTLPRECGGDPVRAYNLAEIYPLTVLRESAATFAAWLEGRWAA